MPQPSSYAICVSCGFGYEDKRCDYCAEGLTRSVPALKALLAESEVLLLSAKRVNNAAAINFYTHQVGKCNEALKAQGELF